MKLSASLLRPCFFRRRRRRRGVSLTNNPPEPSSPKVTCIGQVRVKSQRKAKQCRRRISSGGDTASFRSGGASVEPSRRRDQRWVHLPSLSVFLHAVGHDFCCFFRCCRCNCFSVREKRKSMKKKKIERSGSGCFEDGRSELFGRWLVAVNGGEDGRTEIEVVVGTGDEEGTAAMTSAESSRRHVFDDIEVIGDRIEVKGRGFVNAICHVPPKNALLLMRCRSDPLKMAAIANRISSDAIRYQNNGSIEEEEEEEDGGGGEIESKCLDIEHEICTVAQVLHQEEKETVCNVGETGFCNEEKEEEIEQELDEEEEEEVESNMSSFEALLVQESTKEPTKSNYDHNPNQNDSNKQEKKVAPLPENQETAAAAAALPECLLLMMREPKLSMEVSKETWVCATDFVRLLPERPRKKVSAAAAGHEPVVKKRAAVEKAKPRVPPPPHCKKSHDTQPARSSCSAAAAERKWTSGCACEPLALTRCKSEPMSTAAAKLMPEAGVGAAGVGF